MTEPKIDAMTLAEIHDNLRNYLDSGYVIDPVGYLEVVADRLQAAIAVLDTAELARGAAVSVPSEPVRPEPRVWAMPPEPGPDVVRVRDVYGQIFERATAYGGEKPEEGWLGDTFASEADVPDLFLTWELLMKHHTPVTEIGPEPKIRDTHGEYAIEVFDLEPGGADCFVVLRQGDEELKHFRYPAYKIWTLLAHWKEYDEVNPAAEVVEP